MKKKFALLLAICILASLHSAVASALTNLTEYIIKYNTIAEHFGAPELKEDNMIDQDGSKIFPIGQCFILFELDANDEIKACSISCYEKCEAHDFLLSCMTVITFLGEMDFDAYGQLLHQYAEISGGKSQGLPCSLGSDIFNITDQVNMLLFTYANIDLQYWY